MRSLELVRYALSTGVAVISLCSCGGTSMPARTATNTTGEAAPRQRSKTFNYTGKRETFIVPAGVTQLTVVAHGAEGAGTPYYPSSDTPGLPGRIYAIVPVHPGNKLYVFVGGSGAHGGFNGGGSGGSSGKYSGNAGGGASDVRMGGDSVQNRIIVAAGGGGAGVAIYTYGVGYGGDGGGVVGKSGGGGGSHYGGGGGAGGTQSAGGSGGAGGQGYYGGDNGEPGSSGTLGVGGNGGDGAYYDRYSGGGGGGGGGYYGGGGGGGGSTAYYSSRYLSSEGGGGGGGSSYIEPNAIKSRTWSGWKKAKGDGLVVFSWQ